MLFGAFSWAAASAAVIVWSYLIYRILRTDRAVLNLAICLFLLIFVITAFVLVMGLLGLLRPAAMLLASVMGLACVMLVPGLRHALAEGVREMPAILETVQDVWRDLPRWLRWLGLLVIAFSLARFTFLVWALPPFVYDALTYHLTNVAEWTQRGRIAPFETPIYRIYSPANYEVFATWFTVFLHHDVVVEASGIPAYVLAALAVYSIGRSLSVTRSGAIIAVLAYGSTPALLLATTGTKNDPIMAALYLLAAALIVDLVWRRRGGEARNPVGLLTTLALVLLVGFGTKPYLAHLSPGLLVMGAVGLIQSRGLPELSGLVGNAWPQLRQEGPRLWLPVSLALAAGLFLGLYWYGRNWLLMGNPFYPYGVSVGGKAMVEGVRATVVFCLAHLRESLPAFWYKFGDRRAAIMPS